MARKPSFAVMAEPKAEPIHAQGPAEQIEEAGEVQPMLPMKAPKIVKARRGKKQLGGYFPPEVGRALKILAAEQDKTVEGLLGEAINLLLRHYNKHPERMS